ncbi:hypothetical protein [Microcoleus sp. D2_18a_B4]|uniref:hypothetical protein n=1 Tax=Microcoleus sp. D2_18a_B4 TaxID=3055329 RepID=UPI002FD36B52
MLYTNSEVQWLATQNGAEVSTATVKNCNINHATTCLNVAIGSISMKAAKLEIGIRSQESGVRRKEEEGRRKEEEGRSHNKCFYKYEMLPWRSLWGLVAKNSHQVIKNATVGR